MQSKKSQIVSKQIADSTLLARHFSGDTINNILSYKKLGIARIATGITIPYGVTEIDVTDSIYNNSFFQNITFDGSNNGILLSGLGERNLTTDSKVRAKGECLFGGIPFDYDENPSVGGNQGQVIGTGDGITSDWQANLLKFPVFPTSIEVVIISGNATLTATDFPLGDGNITGDVTDVGATSRTNYIDYRTGELKLRFSSPPDINTPITVNFKYTSYENYKVLIRDSKTRKPFLNIVSESSDLSYKGEIFAELYAEEFYVGDSNNKGFIQVSVGQDYAIGSTFPQDWSGYSGQSGVEFDSEGSILCEWNGGNFLSDKSIGKVEPFSIGVNNQINLSKKSEMDYSGDSKFVRYKLRFFYYNNNWEPIPFYFNSSEVIDFLFIEAYDMKFSDINNIYNYLNFYRVGDTMASYLQGKMEDRLFNDSVIGGISSSETYNLPEWGAYEVPYLEFQVYNRFYDTNSLEVYIDGVRIMHYKTGDNPDDKRIIETDPAHGKFILLNMDYADFYKYAPTLLEPETGTQQVYATYSLGSMESGI